MRGRRSAQRGLAFDALVAAMLASLVVAAIASSHPTDDFYRDFWPDSEVTWRFKNDVPVNEDPGDGTSFRARIVDGSRKWNVLPPDLRFEKLSGDVTAWGAQDCPGFMQNAVHWDGIDGPGGTFGRTFLCTFVGPSEIFLESFQIRYDSDDTWYSGTSSSVPSQQVDAFSLGAHEFGHATGWRGHFGAMNVELCGPGAPRQTMCPDTNRGSSEWRTLEDHDRHTFDNAY
jgi:hypothetical protein